jgi:hypothetical protein
MMVLVRPGELPMPAGRLVADGDISAVVQHAISADLLVFSKF